MTIPTGDLLLCGICGANATSWGIGYEHARCGAHFYDGLMPLPNFELPPEIREILRDVARGVHGPDLSGRAAAAIVKHDLCPRCAGTGQEVLDTGGAPGVAWGTCFGCRPEPVERTHTDACIGRVHDSLGCSCGAALSPAPAPEEPKP